MRNAVLLMLLATALMVVGWFVLGPAGRPGQAVLPHSRAATGAVEATLEVDTEVRGYGGESETTWTDGASAFSERRASGAAPVSLVSSFEAMEASVPRTLVFVEVPGREPIAFPGRVLSSAGQPVAKAEISLRAGSDRASATSDATGRFELTWARGLPADLSIEHPEFVDLRAAAVDVEEYGVKAEFRLALSGSIRGHVVTPPGFASELVEVEAWRVVSKSEKSWPHFTCAVGPDGFFFLADLEPGQYALCPRAEGTSGRYTAGHEVSNGSEAFVELKCVDGGAIDGQLVGPPGVVVPSLAGSRVELVPRDISLPKTLANERRLVVDIADDGSFHLVGIAPGAHRLQVELPWGGVVGFPIDFDASGERIEREFRVPPPAGLEGLVTDAAGRPVSGASVVVTRRKDKGSLVDALGPATEGAASSDLRGKTDFQGRFRFKAVPANDSLVVVARLGEGPPAWSEVPVLAAGERRVDLVLELPTGLELRGRVEALSATGAVGEHLAGALVLARYQSDGREFTFAVAETDEDGSFVLGGLIAGPARIEARAKGYIDASLSLELALGVDPPVADLALERALELEGRVVDESGAGVDGLRVRASVADPDQKRLEPRGKLKKEPSEGPADRLTHSDEYGRFRFSALSVGDWFLAPTGGEYELVEVTPRRADASFVEAGGTAELVVRRRAKAARAALDLVVVRRDTGLAPTGVEVHGEGAASVAIDGGEVAITALAPAPTRLIVTAEGCAPRILELELFPGAYEHLGLIELEPGARLTVEVHAPNGAPVKTAKVRLIPKAPEDGGPLAGTPSLTLKHVGGGRYRLAGVPMASWELRVSAKNARAAITALEITRANENKRVNLVAKKSGAGS